MGFHGLLLLLVFWLLTHSTCIGPVDWQYVLVSTGISVLKTDNFGTKIQVVAVALKLILGLTLIVAMNLPVRRIHFFEKPPSRCSDNHLGQICSKVFWIKPNTYINCTRIVQIVFIEELVVCKSLTFN